MRDKRPVDELSISELERILAIRRREERLARARRYSDRQVAVPSTPTLPLPEDIHAVPLALADSSESSPQPDPALIDRPTAVDQAETQIDTAIDPRFEDDFEPPLVRERPRDPRPRRVLWWNRLLVGVEVIAVGGLIYLLGTLFVSLQAVTTTTDQIQAAYQATNAAAFVPPTATPAIDVATVVLPGGHTFDTTNGSGQFNLSEVPVQYRTAYQQILSVAPPDPPTASPQAALTIEIPALNINAPVVEGDSWDDLQRGVGHHPRSANPGEAGNMVLAGHDDIYGSIFKDLSKLKPGDQVVVTTQTGRFVYTVASHEIVAPTETRVMDNSRRDIRQLTLITCYPYQVDNQRYIVYAQLNQ